jgi:hypothetical protein
MSSPALAPVPSGGAVTSAAPLISITNVNHQFGTGALSKQVLFDVSLNILPGEIVRSADRAERQRADFRCGIKGCF